MAAVGGPSGGARRCSVRPGLQPCASRPSARRGKILSDVGHAGLLSWCPRAPGVLWPLPAPSVGPQQEEARSPCWSLHGVSRSCQGKGSGPLGKTLSQQGRSHEEPKPRNETVTGSGTGHGTCGRQRVRGPSAGRSTRHLWNPEATRSATRPLPRQTASSRNRSTRALRRSVLRPACSQNSTEIL